MGTDVVETGPYARATSGRAARDDPRSEERSGGDGYDAPTRGHDGHLHEESARPLLPRRAHAAAARLRIGEQARVDRPDLSRPAAGFPADRVLNHRTRAGVDYDDAERSETAGSFRYGVAVASRNEP